MTVVDDIKTGVSDLTSTLTSIDSKLDEVKSFIESLEAGSVTPEQLQQVLDGVNAAKAEAVAVLTKTDSLDAPAVSPADPVTPATEDPSA